MFPRRSIKLSAWAALIAVVCVLLLPASLSAFGYSANQTAITGLSRICSLDGVTFAPQDQQPVASVHQPCVFCTSIAALFPQTHAPRVVLLLEGVPVALGLPTADALPPNVAATQPLNPRAPPRC